MCLKQRTEQSWLARNQHSALCTKCTNARLWESLSWHMWHWFPQLRNILNCSEQEVQSLPQSETATSHWQDSYTALSFSLPKNIQMSIRVKTWNSAVAFCPVLSPEQPWASSDLLTEFSWKFRYKRLNLFRAVLAWRIKINSMLASYVRMSFACTNFNNW